MHNQRHLTVLLVVFAAFTPSLLQAQQNEIPPASDATSPATQGAPDIRIVEGRPRLYSIKRLAHPVSWLEFGISPIVRLAEKFAPDASQKEKKAPRDSGIKVGARGLGSGSGFGPEVKLFHNNLLNRGIEFELPAVVTYKFYQSVGARFNFPLISGGENRLGFEVLGDYVSRPSDSFYGLGNDSSLSNDSRFRTVSRRTAAAIDARTDNWSWRLETGFRSVGVTEPRKFRAASDVFQGEDIPGLTSGATMNVTTASIQRDTTDHPDLPASGGVQRLEVSLNEGQRGGDFSYWRYGMELKQFLPLSDDRRKVIALRASLETNQPKGGSAVPFFDLPTIGSRSTVRGFRTRRFSDRSAMSASVEYRYRIWRYFDWGLFVDGGQVAPEIGNFAMDRFHTGYGMRFIPRSQEGRGIIVDLARSREAWLFYIDFSPLF